MPIKYFSQEKKSPIFCAKSAMNLLNLNQVFSAIYDYNSKKNQAANSLGQNFSEDEFNKNYAKSIGIKHEELDKLLSDYKKKANDFAKECAENSLIYELANKKGLGKYGKGNFGKVKNISNLYMLASNGLEALMGEGIESSKSAVEGLAIICEKNLKDNSGKSDLKKNEIGLDYFSKKPNGLNEYFSLISLFMGSESEKEENDFFGKRIQKNLGKSIKTIQESEASRIKLQEKLIIESDEDREKILNPGYWFKGMHSMNFGIQLHDYYNNKQIQ